MNAELRLLLNDIEFQRQQILQQVSALTADRYHRSVNGKWSVAHILTHLLTSEKLSLGYMKKKSLGIASVGNSGIFESIKSFGLKISQRLPLMRYKAPKYVVENTPQELSFEDLSREWSELRRELQKFLENIDDKNIRKMIYKHPVAGRLDVIQAVGFFREHIIHHLPQIKRLL